MNSDINAKNLVSIQIELRKQEKRALLQENLLQQYTRKNFKAIESYSSFFNAFASATNFS